MQKLKVAIMMGSDSDWGLMEACAKQLKAFGIEFEARVMSAHRTPAIACEYAANARANGFGTIICAAGMAAHLAGVVAAHTTLPVIAIPINSSLDGLDALLAMVQMPPGIPVATVAIGGAKNAAILAAQILAVSDAGLADKLAVFKANMVDEYVAKDKALCEKVKAL